MSGASRQAKDCPSPSGRRWREAPDEGSPPHDLSERVALTRRFAPPSPGGRGIIVLLVLLSLFTTNLFGQAAAGNEKFDQKQYADAANAYEKIPAAQRDGGIYNRLGISYHLTNQLKAAENAYRSALRLQGDNADVLNNLSVL